MARPFAVDPTIMTRIRPMMSIDIPTVVEMHTAAMGESLWARLGPKFLQALYSGLIDNDRFLGFVYLEDNTVLGFIAGSTNTPEMMSEVFRSHGLLLASCALPALRKPGVLFRLLETPFYFKNSSPGEEIVAESLFCSFAPNLRGKRISGHINKVLFDDLLSRGHQFVKVTTEVTNEGANRQLKSWGFDSKGTFQFYGKDMVAYVLDLTASDRVEDISRHPSI